MLGRVPDVDVAQGQRREAEAQHVGRAEVADDAALDQRLHDGVGALVARQAHLAAAQRVCVGRDDAQAVPGAALAHQPREQSRQRQRFRAQRRHAAQRLGREQGVDAALQRSHGQDRGRAAEVARDPRGRAVVVGELEGRGVPDPARQRLLRLVDKIGVDPHEGWRARAAVEVLVATADGEVGARGFQVHRQRAGGVGQVPDGERTRFVGQPAQPRHVVDAAAAVVHVRERQRGDVVAAAARQPRGDVPGVQQLQPPAVLTRQRVGDVEVGGEVLGLGDDDAALPARIPLARQPQRGTQHLVQVDRGRVGHHQLARSGPHQARDLVAHALRQRHPAGAVPAADQALAPLLGDDLGHTRGGGARQRAQRVAVQVDQPFGQVELLAQRRQRVGAVERGAVFTGDGHRASERGVGAAGSARSTARTGEASACTSFSGSAISS